MTSRNLALAAVALAGLAALPGCGGPRPSDAYSGMKMLSPDELDEAGRVRDVTDQAERAHNAEFKRDNPSR